MREYFRYFKWLYIALFLLLALFGFLSAGHAIIARVADYERTNTECATPERVFDYGGVLTDKEEDKLRKLIARREKQTGCDIVLVTLQESLKDYAREIDPYVDYDEFVRVYAEDFYESNGFGYDRSNGDGVILVDNWYREEDGGIYTWFCTTGRAKEVYADADIDHLLDNVYRYIQRDPYRAYKTYVNDFYNDMLGINIVHLNVSGIVTWIVGLTAAVIFVAGHWKGKSGAQTVTATTYVNGAEPSFGVREDRFLRKSVVRHKIRSGGSGGGGGGHSSHSGGGSHGGGGHSR